MYELILGGLEFSAGLVNEGPQKALISPDFKFGGGFFFLNKDLYKQIIWLTSL